MVRALRADMFVLGFICFRAKRRIGLEWMDTTLTAVTFRKLAMIGKKNYFYYVVLLVLQERTFFNLLCRDSLAPSDLTLPGTS